MSRRSCVFCGIVAGRAPAHVVWADDRHVAFMDVNPVAAGHLLLVPRAHVETVYDLDPGAYADLFERVRRLAGPVADAAGAPRAGIAVEGYGVAHAHVHLVPVWRGGDLDPCRQAPADDAALRAAADRLRALLHDAPPAPPTRVAPHPPPVVRALGPDDAAEVRALRLRALRESPESFGSTYAEEVERPVAATAARLADPAAGVVLGAALHDGGPLVGVAGCYRERGRKREHLAVLWGMYVADEARGRGVGGALVDAVVAHARAWPGVARLTLTVVPENVAARRLYLAHGFVPFAREPDALRDGARRWDMEHLARPLHDGPA